ncbi:MAG: hypothetical protein AAGI54_13955 [Planctomycetota bacterium]
MRNIFDQYTQPENKLTHALACTLASDDLLCRKFISWTARKAPPRRQTLKIVQQQVPGKATSGNELNSRGLPDACIYTDDGWCLLIEVKAQARPSSNQLRRHLSTARRHGYESPNLLLIAIDPLPASAPIECEYQSWPDVYRWFRRHATRSKWAREFTHYVEAFETAAIGNDYEIRGTLTMFDGLGFHEDGYSYASARRQIRMLGNELQSHPAMLKLGVDRDAPRRSAITGTGESRVWDFLPLRRARGANNFTDHPHFTIGIAAEVAKAQITIPNGVRGGFRSNLTQIGASAFSDLLASIYHASAALLDKSQDSRVCAEVVQRHFKSQRSVGVLDADLSFDLRTTLAGKRKEAKYQPEWAEMAFKLLKSKRSNMQFAIRTDFSYACPAVQSRDVVALYIEAYRCMSKVLSLVP